MEQEYRVWPATPHSANLISACNPCMYFPDVTQRVNYTTRLPAVRSLPNSSWKLEDQSHGQSGSPTRGWYSSDFSATLGHLSNLPASLLQNEPFGGIWTLRSVFCFVLLNQGLEEWEMNPSPERQPRGAGKSWIWALLLAAFSPSDHRQHS